MEAENYHGHSADLMRGSGPDHARKEDELEDFLQQRYDIGERRLPGQSGEVIRSICNWVPSCHCRFTGIIDPPDPPAPTDIRLRPPTKYTHSSNIYPTKRFWIPERWLYRTWTMTSSTQSKWHSAGDVRHTFRGEWLPWATATFCFPLCAGLQKFALMETIEYEKWGLKISIPAVSIKLESGRLGWKRRGSSWKNIDSSRWEILGWGERPLPAAGRERWLVIWTSSSLFSKEGVNIYSDQPNGLSTETLDKVIESLFLVLDAPKFRSILGKSLKMVHTYQSLISEESLAEFQKT